MCLHVHATINSQLLKKIRFMYEYFHHGTIQIKYYNSAKVTNPKITKKTMRIQWVFPKDGSQGT